MSREEQLIQANQELMNGITDVIKRMTHDPQANIDSEIRFIESKNASRRTIIHHMRTEERTKRRPENALA